MKKGEILITTGISFFLLCSMGIDSPAPQGQSAAAYITETATKRKRRREESFDAVLQAEIAKLKASKRGL